MNKLPENIPENLTELLTRMVEDFPSILGPNLVGIYLWGSLTYQAFDERCSDVDCIVVTHQDITDSEFSALQDWFAHWLKNNPWTHKLDLRFVIDKEFLDKNSRCCGFHFGKFIRHGSDGNPIIWVNIGQSGITLWGKPAPEIAPPVTEECLNEALLLELDYLKQDLTTNKGDTSDLAFFHNAYAVLTACRIFYTARNRALVSKDKASAWAKEIIPPKWQRVIDTAKANRIRGQGLKTARLENEALGLVGFVENEVRTLVEKSL